MTPLWPSRDEVDEMVATLRRVKAGERVETGYPTPHFKLVHLGFLEEAEINKPCRECGRPRLDYRYNKITPAGRALLAFADTSSPPITTEENDNGDASRARVSGE